MHGRPKINFKSHNKSRLSTTSLFLGTSMCILTRSDLYSQRHASFRAKHGYLIGFGVVQQLQTLCLQCLGKVHKLQNFIKNVQKNNI
jgi:hypothetical protein